MKFDASRRKMLQQLLGVTGLTLAIPTQELLNPEPWERLSRSLIQPSNINDEALRHFAKLTETCWHLSNASEASTVERILPTYLPKIEALAQQPSKYQKTAAGIASQGYILAAEVDKGNISAMERYCDLAVEYSQITEDQGIQVAALKQQATIALVADKKEKALEIYIQTLPLLPFVSPLLRARIFMGIASAYARVSKKNINLAQKYLDLAHESFPTKPEEDPSYLYTICSKPVLYLYDGLTHMDLEHFQDAWNSLENVNGIAPKMLVPESTRIEIINLQASAAVGLGDMERGRTYLQAGITAARTQGYNLWASESFDVYQQMLLKWPSEQQVKALAELFHQ